MQRYSLSMSQTAGNGPPRATMTPDAKGEWVRFADIGAPQEAVPRLQPCDQRVELPKTNGIAHSYCVLSLGHEGKCQT